MYSQIQKYAVYMVCEKEGTGLSGKFKVKETLRGSGGEAPGKFLWIRSLLWLRTLLPITF